MRILLAFILLLSLSACAPAGPSYTIAIIPSAHLSAMESYQTNKVLLESGMRDAAAAAGARVTFTEPAATLEEETALVGEALQSKPSALIISPLSPESALPALREAAAAGVPVVCLETCTGESAAAFVPGPNHDMGSLSGVIAVDRIQAQLGGTALVAVLPCASEPACGLRKDAFLSHLMDMPEVGIILPYAPSADQAAVERFLAENKGVNLIWAAGESETRAALQAVRAQGLAGKVLVLGAGLDQETAAQIGAQGGLEATAAPLVYQAGQDAVMLALALARGDTPRTTLRKSALLVTAARRETATEYLASLGKMLLPTLPPSMPETGSGIKPSCNCKETATPQAGETE